MQTTMEPTTTATPMDEPEPSLPGMYEKATIIRATVTVFPPPTDEGGNPTGQPPFEVDPIIVPGSGEASVPAYSVVIYTLVDGSNGGFATLEFATETFSLSQGGSVPTGLTFVEPGAGLLMEVPDPVTGVLDGTPPRRKLLIFMQNNVQGLAELDYIIHIHYRLSNPGVIHHGSLDPTIVITTEPIDG